MKKSALAAYIKEEIISTLSEATYEVSADKVDSIKSKVTDKDIIKVTEQDDEFDFDEKEPTAKDIKKGDSIAKISTKLAANEKEMKTVVNQWKKSEGAEKEEFLKRLKALTKIKKELEGLL
jgi:hypothetical protein